VRLFRNHFLLRPLWRLLRSRMLEHRPNDLPPHEIKQTMPQAIPGAVPGLVVHPPHSPESMHSADFADPALRPPVSPRSTPIVTAEPAPPMPGSFPPPRGKPPLLRSHSDTADQHHHAVPYEQLIIYKSYARNSVDSKYPYVAFVRGWVFHPHLNRKGKLMVAAVERLVGNPGKYSSIADAAAAHVAEQHRLEQKKLELGAAADGPAHSTANTPVGTPPDAPGTPSESRAGTPVDAVEGTPSGTPTGGTPTQSTPTEGTPLSSRPNSSESLSTLTAATMPALTSRLTSHVRSASPPSHKLTIRPPLFRSRSSKSSVNSAPGSPPGPSAMAPSTASATASATTSPQLSADSAPASEIPALSLKRPGMRRTKTFENHKDKDKPKYYSASHLARKSQKHTIRERMASISHKSLAMRDVKLVVESEPDAQGKTAKRTFWTTTDDTGRFGIDCATPFRPVSVSAVHLGAAHSSSLLFVPKKGISVISDIDDTVRHTGVTKSKREMLQNVLAKSFDDCGLDGVAKWYQDMADAGAHFHYVSNSPWQLYDVVSGFLSHHAFPEGSIHLKKYAGVLDGLTEPAKGRKRASLEKIVQDFPLHKFILIGDSGEADLEAYSDLARRFPNQILAIYIRDISLAPDEPLAVHYRPRPTKHKGHRSVDVSTLVSEQKPTPSSRSGSREPEDHTDAHAALANVMTPPALENLRLERPSGPVDSMDPSPPPTSPTAQTAPELIDLSTPKHSPDSSQSTNEILQDSEPKIKEPSRDSVKTAQTAQGGASAAPDAAAAAAVPSSSSSPSSSSPSSASPSSSSSSLQPPAPPPRPKLLRRTSSKIREGLTTVASVSSNVTSRLLAPQLPPRPSRGREATPSARPLKKLGNSLHGHSSSSSSISSLGGTHPLPRARTASSFFDSRPSSMHRSHSDNDLEGIFVPSSQETFEHDRTADRRSSDHWRSRVAKQQQHLPPHVALRMYRAPNDIESESLDLIKSKK